MAEDRCPTCGQTKSEGSMKITFFKDGDSWGVQLMPNMQVGGFPTFHDAAVWTAEWIRATFAAMLSDKTRKEIAASALETHKQLAGAVILAEDPKAKKQ